MSLMSFVDKYYIKKPRFRRFFMKWFYGKKAQFKEIFSAKLFIDSVKENGYWRAADAANKSSVFRDEATILINLSNYISNDTAFIDVGANVGLYTSVISRFKKLYPGLNIYAFEANPDTFSRLKKTVDGMTIHIYNNALSNAETELEFVQGVVSHVFAEKTYTKKYHLKSIKTIKIHTKCLDKFIIEGKEIIIKIDVEGHEYEVLQGAKSFFDENRVSVVYIDGCQKKEQILSFLASYGFKFLNGKTLDAFQQYDFSLLAVKTII